MASIVSEYLVALSVLFEVYSFYIDRIVNEPSPSFFVCGNEVAKLPKKEIKELEIEAKAQILFCVCSI